MVAGVAVHPDHVGVLAGHPLIVATTVKSRQIHIADQRPVDIVINVTAVCLLEDRG